MTCSKTRILISMRVPDLEKARQWYADVLGHAPAFEAPFAVAFATGTCSLLLLPLESTGPSGCERARSARATAVAVT